MVKLSAEELNKNILQNSNFAEVKDIIVKLSSYPSHLQDKPFILFHLCGWLYGGAERVLTTLLNFLSKKYKVALAVFEPVKNTTFKLDKDIVFIKICGNNELNDRLFQLVEILKPDIFVGNNNSLKEVFTIYPRLKEKNIKTIAYNHEYFFFIHSNNYLKEFALEKNRCLKEASASIYLTNFSTAAYSLINDNGIKIPNPNTFKKQEELSFRDGGKVILSVGRFNDRIKRVDNILKIFKKVLSNEPDAKLMLAGPYDLDLKVDEESGETVTDLINKLGLKNANINFMGMQEDVKKAYKNADLLLMTSDNEGFGMVLTEAATFGLPLVAFEIPGLDDIIKNGENGFFVKKENIDGIAEKIVLLLQNNTMRKEFSEYSKKHVESFDIEIIGKTWEKLINAILSDDIDVYLSNNKPEIENISYFTRKNSEEYESFSKSALLKNTEKPLIRVNSSLKQYGFRYIITTIIKNTKTYGLKDTLKKINKYING